jgi:KDO2-lipid IV(A) lauroyltransferase
MSILRYIPETVFLYLMFGIFSVLPVVTASNFGGSLARVIGPKLAASRKARANITKAFPEKTEKEIETIITEMWDNLGRVMAEYPHLEKIARDRTHINGMDIFNRLFNDNQGGIFFSAHQGNWEINGAVMLKQNNTPLHLTYRALNNPMADRLLRRARTLNGQIPAIPKARSSAKDLMSAMKNKNYVGILLDQKYNEGLAVNFFGRPAMTNPVAVILCQKYGAPLIPVRNVRIGPAQFEITAHEPIPLFAADGSPLPQMDILQKTQDLLEGWIRENPGQWLWLHRRWDSKVFKV